MYIIWNTQANTVSCALAWYILFPSINTFSSLCSRRLSYDIGTLCQKRKSQIFCNPLTGILAFCLAGFGEQVQVSDLFVGLPLTRRFQGVHPFFFCWKYRVWSLCWERARSLFLLILCDWLFPSPFSCCLEMLGFPVKLPRGSMTVLFLRSVWGLFWGLFYRVTRVTLNGFHFTYL